MGVTGASSRRVNTIVWPHTEQGNSWAFPPFRDRRVPGSAGRRTPRHNTQARPAAATAPAIGADHLSKNSKDNAETPTSNGPDFGGRPDACQEIRRRPILRFMYGALLILLASAFGQAPATLVPIDAPPPAEVTDARTYELSFRGGRPDVTAFVSVNGDVVTYYEDVPWSVYPAQKKSAHRSTLEGDPVEESASSRKRRLERGFADAGYTALNGFWAPRELARQTKRAQEMYAAVQAAREPAPAPEQAAADAPAETPAPAAPAPSPLQRWGLHGAIVAVGLVAAGLVAKRFLFA